ncbi:MAG TPA: hypothetical protein VEI03_23810 [Stellaceae bacterium]|nr:hypothetical protein [Stellaceae bacterium]
MAPDRARIYVYRPYNYIGSAGSPTLTLDDRTIGDAVLNGVLYCDVVPGPHALYGTYNTGILDLDLKPGQYAYVRVSVGLAGYTMTLVRAEEGAAEAQSFPLVRSLCSRTAPRPPVEEAVAKGMDAERRGDLAGALSLYREAIGKYAAGGFDPIAELVNHAIDVSLKMSPRPSLPAEATRHATAAVSAIKSAKTSDDFEFARREYQSALASAPWWSDAWFNLAALDEQTGTAGTAASDLAFYLRAAPDAPDADAVRKKIGQLRSKAPQ